MDAERTLILATVVGVNDSNVLYPCCIQCYAKMLRNLQRNVWHCVRCNVSCEESHLMWRYRLSLCIADSSASCHVSLFGDIMAQHFGCSAHDFHRFLTSNSINGEPLDQKGDVMMHALEMTLVGNSYLFGLKLPAPPASRSLRQPPPVSRNSAISLANLLMRRATKQVVDGKASDFVAVQIIPTGIRSPAKCPTVLDTLKQLCSQKERISCENDDLQELPNSQTINHFEQNGHASQTCTPANRASRSASFSQRNDSVSPSYPGSSNRTQSQASCSATAMFSCDSSMEREFHISQQSQWSPQRLDPLVHAATSTVYSTGGCMHKGVKGKMLRNSRSVDKRRQSYRQRHKHISFSASFEASVNKTVQDQSMPFCFDNSVNPFLNSTDGCKRKGVNSEISCDAGCDDCNSTTASTLHSDISSTFHPAEDLLDLTLEPETSTPKCINGKVNPHVQQATSTVNSTGSCMHKGVKENSAVSKVHQHYSSSWSAINTSCEILRSEKQEQIPSIRLSAEMSLHTTCLSSMNDSSLLLAALQADLSPHDRTCIEEKSMFMREPVAEKKDFNLQNVASHLSVDMPDSEDLSLFLDVVALEAASNMTTSEQNIIKVQSVSNSVSNTCIARPRRNTSTCTPADEHITQSLDFSASKLPASQDCQAQTYSQRLVVPQKQTVINPVVHASTGTVNKTSGCMHKRVKARLVSTLATMTEQKQETHSHCMRLQEAHQLSTLPDSEDLFSFLDKVSGKHDDKLTCEQDAFLKPESFADKTCMSDSTTKTNKQAESSYKENGDQIAASSCCGTSESNDSSLLDGSVDLFFSQPSPGCDHTPLQDSDKYNIVSESSFESSVEGRTGDTNVNPLVHAATSTIDSTGGCMHKGVLGKKHTHASQEKSIFADLSTFEATSSRIDSISSTVSTQADSKRAPKDIGDVLIGKRVRFSSRKSKVSTVHAMDYRLERYTSPVTNEQEKQQHSNSTPLRSCLQRSARSQLRTSGENTVALSTTKICLTPIRSLDPSATLDAESTAYEKVNPFMCASTSTVNSAGGGMHRVSSSGMEITTDAMGTPSLKIRRGKYTHGAIVGFGPEVTPARLECKFLWQPPSVHILQTSGSQDLFSPCSDHGLLTATSPAAVQNQQENAQSTSCPSRRASVFSSAQARSHYQVRLSSLGASPLPVKHKLCPEGSHSHSQQHSLANNPLAHAPNSTIYSNDDCMCKGVNREPSQSASEYNNSSHVLKDLNCSIRRRNFPQVDEQRSLHRTFVTLRKQRRSAEVSNKPDIERCKHTEPLEHTGYLPGSATCSRSRKVTSGPLELVSPHSTSLDLFDSSAVLFDEENAVESVDSESNVVTDAVVMQSDERLLSPHVCAATGIVSRTGGSVHRGASNFALRRRTNSSVRASTMSERFCILRQLSAAHPQPRQVDSPKLFASPDLFSP